MENKPTTTIETDGFIAKADALMTAAERNDIVSTIAYDPMMGDAMRGCGGFRKARFAGKGKGKSGGFRVIWFPGTDTSPNYVIDVFSKSDKVNLTKAQQAALAKIAKQLKG
tara:strand:+ start:28175 stop:28507 length:333 start_codon:yes stop_codon:yes gene_type:complete